MENNHREAIRDSDLIQSVAEAALYNQKSIARSTAALDKAIAELRGDVPLHIAEAVRRAVLKDLDKTVSATAERIALQITKSLKEANVEAEKATSAYAQALRTAQSGVAQLVLLAGMIAVVCSVIVSLIVMRFR